MSTESEKDLLSMKLLKEILALQEKSFRSAMALLIEEVKSDVREIRKDVQDLRESVNFVAGKYDDTKSKVDAVELKMKAAFLQMEGLSTDMNDNFDGMEDRQDYLENQSRRNNIKIFGISENDDEKTWEDTELVVKKVIQNKLGIQDEITIERAHRIGEKVKTRPPHGRHLESASHSKEAPPPRPIVAKIQSWKVKENILKIARMKKPKDVQFRNDFSKITLEKRAEKIPKMLEERRKGKIAFLIMDKLVVYEKPKPSKRDRGASIESGLGPEDDRHEEDSEIIIQNRRSRKL